MMRVVRRFCAALALSWAAAASSVGAQQVRGVNPADIDTRFDVIGKYNWLPGDSYVYTSTLKFDYRATDKIGLNFELPVHGHYHFGGVPIAGTMVGAFDDRGVGDLFARVRYIDRFGQWSLGGALEAVAPTATEQTLGSGKYQLNPAALAVYAWSPAVISAGVVKSYNSLGGEDGRADIRNVELRGIQAFMFPNKMFVTFDAKYTWELINTEDRWFEGAAELGYQFSPTLVGSVRASRKWGDREDRGAVEMAVKNFF